MPLRQSHSILETNTPSSPELRSELDRITTEIIEDNVGQQVDSMAELRRRLPHSITLVAKAIPGDAATYSYTCFQHAFELTEPPQLIVDIATLWHHVYPNSKFVAYLIEHHLEEVTASELRDQDLVVYFNDGVAKHAGRVQGDSVVSKWGTAHLWRHALYEVPSAYGNEVRFFRPLCREDSQEAFVRFAEFETGETFFQE
jgi:hypothetical protein